MTRILVVDDDPQLVRALRINLRARGYDVGTGRQLWESRLPAGGQATPMTYTGADGRQYLLVVAGGHGSTHTQAGDSVIAYALPR